MSSIPNKYLLPFAVVVFGLLLTAEGCSTDQEYSLQGTDRLPGATGNLVTSENNLGTTTLTIEATYPDTYEPPLDDGHYIAWLKYKHGVEKLGELHMDGQNGELIATTGLKHFTILITAETSKEVSKPETSPLLVSQPVSIE